MQCMLQGFGATEPRGMDDLLMSPFGLTDEFLQLFGRIKEQIEHDQQFMNLGKEWTSEGFGIQQPNMQGHTGIPFQHMEPSGPHETQQRRQHASGSDVKLSWDQAAQQLRQLGALVYLPEDEEQKELDWSDMAGYDGQKRTVEDLVLMSVKHADEYERVAKKTRKDGKHQRPKVCSRYIRMCPKILKRFHIFLLQPPYSAL